MIREKEKKKRYIALSSKLNYTQKKSHERELAREKKNFFLKNIILNII
jgi:hypothetical protein